MCRVFQCGYISTSLFAAGLLALISGSTAHAQVEVWVEGGQEDRPVAVVTFTVAGVSGSWHAVDSLGRTASMQVSRSGQAQLVLADLRAGERRWLHLRLAVAARPRVIVERAGHLASFRVDDRPMMAYHMEKGPMPRSDIDSIYHRAGYLHPVYTPGGRLVTDDYPPNQIHHHGIWAAWTRTRFQGRTPDFWNMGRGTGRVDVSSIDSLWSGAVSGGVRAEHRYVDLAGRTVALYETWQVEAYATELPLNIFDLTLWQRTAGDSALSLSEHLYGGMGLRGHRDWNGEEHADFLTSEGRTRADGHATRARWCHVGGRVEGERVGIAVLGHPDNLEAPQPMRIHPSEPFFNYAPSQAGEFHIRPGTVTRWRYRFVTYDGPPDPLLLEALWTDFAQPARVSIVN
ncbi:MAG: PmoA family protein [Bacteroidota bacterium]|nr:PmoA family protein [Bacteroidota bacterium]